MQTEMRTLPAFWASYLINGDASNLEAEEVQEIVGTEGFGRDSAQMLM